MRYRQRSGNGSWTDDLAFDYGPLLPAEEKERSRQREMDGPEL